MRKRESKILTILALLLVLSASSYSATGEIQETWNRWEMAKKTEKSSVQKLEVKSFSCDLSGDMVIDEVYDTEEDQIWDKVSEMLRKNHQEQSSQNLGFFHLLVFEEIPPIIIDLPVLNLKTNFTENIDQLHSRQSDIVIPPPRV